MIDGLGGVLVYTSLERFPAMRAFYVEALGLRPRSDRDGFVNFELGEQRLTVSVHADLSTANRDPLHVMINLTTTDIRDDYTTAVAAGAASVRAPEPEPWGGVVATLLDPDGNVVQLLQLP
jgi:lactoylglutathione lyase